MRRIMRYVLPLLFIMYWGSVTLCAHSHVVNGVIMVHSHPFKANHQHTQAEAETILFLDHYTASSFPMLAPVVQCFFLLLGVLDIPRTVSLSLPLAAGGIRLRAPPCRVF